MTINIPHFKQRLEEELKKLEEELSSVGRKNPDNPKDWEAKPADFDATDPDSNIVADSIEEFEENAAILKQLEIRYNEIKGALERIEKGTYGICEISGQPIEEERLEANPAARTCIAMKDREHELR